MAIIDSIIKRKNASGTYDTIHPETKASQVDGLDTKISIATAYLNNIGDVNTTGVTDGQTLVYDDATDTWIPGTASGGGGDVSKEDLQNLYIYAKASVAITKGQAIQFAGAQGDHILVKPAVPAEINAEPTLMVGIAETDAAINEFIYVLINGRLTLNTSAYNAGDLLYFASAGTVAGALTTTEPTDPNASIQLAAVSIDGVGNGEFLVRKTILSRHINEVIGLQGALDGKAATNHTHAISAITNLQTSLNAKQDDLGTGTTGQFLRWGALGISYWDTVTASEVGAASSSHTHTFASLTSKPTTLAGFGITDADTSAQVNAKIAALVDSSPATLDTLNELAAALGDDPNFATTVSNSIGTKLSLTGGTLTGTLTTRSITMQNYELSGVNSLSFNDPGVNEGISWSGGNFSIYESPDNLTNAAGNLQFVSGGARRLTVDTSGNVYANAGSGMFQGSEFRITDANTKIVEGSGNAPRMQTDSGYIDIGAMNTSYAHIYTDRPSFYFNKSLLVLGQTVVLTNDSRLSDARTPTAHTHTLGYYSSDFTTNLNTLYSTGQFGFSPSTTGRPEDYGQGINIVNQGTVHNNANNWITQLAFGTNGNTGYFRTKVNAGGWGSWHTLVHSGNIGSQSVSYATSAGRAYPKRVGNIDLNFNWSGQSGQPPWLWGGSDGSNMYVYNPSNFSVNYANSAGNADTTDGYHIVYGSTGTSTSTLYFVP